MTVALTIDGMEVRVDEGSTVLSAARSHGIEIPTLCHYPGLKPAGSCRLCVVRIDGMRGFPASCATTVREGMVIHTDSDEIKEYRRGIFTFLLSAHPYSCLTCRQRVRCSDFQGTIRKAATTTGCQYCPSNGACELQNLAVKLDLDEIPFPIAYRGLKPEQRDPLFERDYNLCVLCGRCIRVCDEMRLNGILSFRERGSRTIVGTAFGESYLDTDCDFCGACVDSCPVGALTDKRGKWEGVPDRTAQSVCPFCSVGCGITLEIRNDRVIRALGDNDHPVNEGQLCVRGRFGMVDFIHHSTRIRRPLVKKSGRLVETSWEEALDTAAALLEPHRGDAFALVGSPSAVTEEIASLQRFARDVMETERIAMRPESGIRTDVMTLLRRLPSAAIHDLAAAATIVVIGSNVVESHPIAGLAIRRAARSGVSLAVIDPRSTRTSREASLHLRPRIGSDGFLLRAMADALSEAHSGDLQPSFAETSTATGISETNLGRLFEILREGGPIVFVVGSGLLRHSEALPGLAAFERMSAKGLPIRVLPMMGEGNAMTTAAIGSLNDAASGTAPDMATDKCSMEITPLQRIVNGVTNGAIRALYLAGAGLPGVDLSDAAVRIIQATHMTDLTQDADVVLPVATFAETGGSLTNLEGRRQRFKASIPPVGESKSAWAILGELAVRLGSEWEIHDVHDAFPASLPAGGESGPDWSDTERDTTEAEGVTTFAEGDGNRDAGGTTTPNTGRTYSLLTERNLFHCYGVSLTRIVKGMEQVYPEGIVSMHPNDMGFEELRDGDTAKISSRWGSVEMTVQADEALPAGSLHIRFRPDEGLTLLPDGVTQDRVITVRISRISDKKEAA